MSPFLSSPCLPHVSISSLSLSLSCLFFVNILIMTASASISWIIATRILYFHHHGIIFHEWYYCSGHSFSFSFISFPYISFLSLCFSYRHSSIFFVTLVFLMCSSLLHLLFPLLCLALLNTHFALLFFPFILVFSSPH